MKKLLLLLAFLASVEVTTAECFHGQVQLLGDTEAQGVVQVCYKGRQAYICPDDSTRWEAKEANTVCTQLGYSSEGANATRECFLVPTVSVNNRFLRFFICNNTASKVTDCYFDSRSFCDGCDSTASITSNERITAAVVQCSKVTCLNDDVRLVGGSTNREGRVEVCVDGRWRAVCSNGWAQEQAGLLCSKLGHLSYGAEIRTFDPHRVPTLNCSMTKEGRIPNLRCDDESDCIEDLGIQCLRNELLDEILGSEHTTTQVQVGSTTITIALGAVTGVLLVLWLGTVTTLVVMCQKRRANRHSTIRTTPTGDPTSTDYLTVTNIATNPAYVAVKVDQREESIYEN